MTHCINPESTHKQVTDRLRSHDGVRSEAVQIVELR
jgi:hypothetical protein